MDFSWCFQSCYFVIAVRAALMAALGLPAVWFLSRIVGRAVKKHVSPHIAFLISKLVLWAGVSSIIISILHEMGFQVSALLGTAGILGIALGFAAQTSISNVISGVFLLIEDTFEVGDIVALKEYEGTIESIDPLSVKIRTVDNRLIRIPNETFLKEAVENCTYYEQRRIEFLIRLQDKNSVDRVVTMIKDKLTNDSQLPKKRAPIVELKEVTSWSVNIVVQVWVNVKERTDSERRIVREIYEASQKLGIPLGISLIK